MMKNSMVIVAQLEPKIKLEGRSRHFREGRSQHQPTAQGKKKRCENFIPRPKQLSLSLESRQSQKQVTPYLQIVSVPIEDRINPKENRYVLMIQPQGVGVCGGQYTADEVYEIARLTKKWDWTLNENNRPHCLPRLEALLDAIIKRSSQQGGES